MSPSWSGLAGSATERKAGEIATQTDSSQHRQKGKDRHKPGGSRPADAGNHQPDDGRAENLAEIAAPYSGIIGVEV